MAYFKIEKSGCCEHKGLCQVRADFYREEGDKGYALTDVRIIPKEGYQGKVEGIMNRPVDMEDYKKWYDSLPTEKRLLPFHTHFIYFEPQHTDEEILFCFEIAKTWLEKNEPMNNVKPVWKETLSADSSARISAIKSTDFTQVSELYSVK
jgi:hypothetical protein